VRRAAIAALIPTSAWRGRPSSVGGRPQGLRENVLAAPDQWTLARAAGEIVGRRSAELLCSSPEALFQPRQPARTACFTQDGLGVSVFHLRRGSGESAWPDLVRAIPISTFNGIGSASSRWVSKQRFGLSPAVLLNSALVVLAEAPAHWMSPPEKHSYSCSPSGRIALCKCGSPPHTRCFHDHVLSRWARWLGEILLRTMTSPTLNH